MTPKEEAAADCKYALSLSQVVIDTHIQIWSNTTDILDEYDIEYRLAILEIDSRMNTSKTNEVFD